MFLEYSTVLPNVTRTVAERVLSVGAEFVAMPNLSVLSL